FSVFLLFFGAWEARRSRGRRYNIFLGLTTKIPWTGRFGRQLVGGPVSGRKSLFQAIGNNRDLARTITAATMLPMARTFGLTKKKEYTDTNSLCRPIGKEGRSPSYSKDR